MNIDPGRGMLAGERSGTKGDPIMRARGRAAVRGTFFVGWFLGFVAIAGSVRIVYAQETTTNPSPNESVLTLAPLSPTQSPEDVQGELETVRPVTGALFDVGIEDLFPRRFNDGRAELRERGFDVGFAYTALFQQASGGPGERNAAGGDVDLFGTWRVIGTPQ